MYNKNAGLCTETRKRSVVYNEKKEYVLRQKRPVVHKESFENVYVETIWYIR